MKSQSNKDIRVLLLEGIHSAAVESLEHQGYAVERLSHALSDQELIEQAKGFHALGIRSKTQVPKQVVAQLKDLLVIGCFCIGTDQVDLDAARSGGLPVFNAPHSNTRSVAELVIAEIIALSRQLGDRNSKAHQGEWSKTATGNHEVRGKTLGIVGYGHIGSQLSILAEALGLKVVFFDIIKKLPLGNALPMDSLDELLRESDFVSFHVPDTNLTRNLVNADRLQQMKKGSYLVNASRGSVVDIAALADFVRSQHIAGAAIDVYPQEPKSNKDSFKSELQGLPNVILTPHIGGSTEEAQEKIGREVADSLTRYISTGSSLGAVNFPQLDAQPIKEGQRLINVHKNVPGVLGEINNIVSNKGVNIKRQQLSTDPSIGFLVMDMELDDAQAVADNIAGLDTSIKTRLI